jgi:hypothetical protein
MYALRLFLSITSAEYFIVFVLLENGAHKFVSPPTNAGVTYQKKPMQVLQQRNSKIQKGIEKQTN